MGVQFPEKRGYVTFEWPLIPYYCDLLQIMGDTIFFIMADMYNILTIVHNFLSTFSLF